MRIAESAELAASRQAFLLLFPADRKAIPANVHTYEMVPPPAAYSEWTRPFQIARWFRGVLDSLKPLTEGSEVIAYIPHPFELPGNYFAFQRGTVHRLELLPDGLINYSHRSLDPENPWRALRYRARVGLRWAAAAIWGLGYRRLAPGHITQFETVPYARTWYISERGLLTKCGVLQELPARRDAPVRDESLKPATLFLDQELTSIADHQLEERLRRASERLLLETQQATLTLYKAHPRGKNRAAELATLGIKLRDISAPELAEHAILTWNVTRLIGFFSTPLVLSKDPNLHRVAIFPSAKSPGIRRPRMVEEIRQALRGADVELVDVD